MDVMQTNTITHEREGMDDGIPKRRVFWKSMAVGGAAGGALVLGAPVVLYAAGFSSIGPIGGSLAAKWMTGAAVSGGIKSGSAYALLQSAAMSGALVSAKTVVVGSVAGSGIVATDGVKRLITYVSKT